MARIVDWEDEPAPLEQLKSEAELLLLVQYWRECAEEAEWRLQFEKPIVD